MHDEPQISRRGEWGDVTFMENNKGKIDHYCQYCPFKSRSRETIIKHVILCIENCKNLQEDIDFVICKFCNFHAQNLGIHLSHIHKIKVKQYKKQFPNVCLIASKSSENYSKSSIANGSWLKKAKENGTDLTEYWKKISDGVKTAILSDPNEIKRRSKLMGEINKTPLMRQKSSKTAIKTSARKNVQENRSAQLKKNGVMKILMIFIINALKN